MIPLLFAADIQPPSDFSTWFGALVLTTVTTAVVTGLISRYAKSGDKVDAVQTAAAAAKAQVEADWKAELRADLKRLLEVQAQLVTGQSLQSKDIAALTTRQDQLEKRQELQAAAHLREVDSLRTELRSAAESRPRRGK